MRLQAKLTDNSTLELTSENGQTAQINWPAEMLPDWLEIDEPFEIAIGEKCTPRQEITNEKSAGELRQLLFELIN